METSDLSRAYSLVGQPTFLKVNLDTILSNLRVIRSFLGQKTDVIAVVKGNAYGHGSVPVSLYLERNGISCFAVGKSFEGKELRDGGVTSDIIVMGNSTEFDMPALYDSSLIPAVSSLEFLTKWLEYMHSKNCQITSKVVVSVDTGIGATGCPVSKLSSIMKSHSITVHSIMTHFVDSWTNIDLTKLQLKNFLDATLCYRETGVKVHAANTCAMYHKIGTELDFVRIGVALYGQPLDSSMASAKLTQELGFQPALSWYARPTNIVTLTSGQSLGYNQAYITTEKIAVLPIGHADGFSRCFRSAKVTTLQGSVCPVVGIVSMDYITVKIPPDCDKSNDFCIMANDYNDVTSAAALAIIADTSTTEVCLRLNKRLPRLYFNGKSIQTF